MDRDDVRRWKRIITQDLRLARYSLLMDSSGKEYLRDRIAEDEAILSRLSAIEQARSGIQASLAPHAA
jgi:hypothetical protein